MKLPRFDIVRKVNEQKLLWLEDAADLRKAKSRIQELASVWPGEFDVMDQCTHQVVAKAIGQRVILAGSPNGEKEEGVCQWQQRKSQKC